MRACVLLFLSLTPAARALIPATPGEQTRRAITSTKDAIAQIRSTNLPPRIFIDYLIPLPPATTDADIDPWPGGLAQQYPYAEGIVRDLLAGVVEDAARDRCSSQVLSEEDCCGFFIQESPLSPDLDVAAVVFPGVDQYAKLQEIEAMVGDRTLIVFNRQFTRAEDFGFFRKEEARGLFERYKWAFAFQEIAAVAAGGKMSN